ncbi:MAG: hypothetical protein ACRDHZ_20380 [Ktedonobacteraceae bacterium]
MSNTILRHLCFWSVVLALLPGLAACGGSSRIIAAPSQQVATINPGFQLSISPIPTLPPYRCGAWSSDNAPGMSSTILIYARLITQDAKGVSGIAANATAHLQSHDQNLGQATSDAGGYVTFTLPLHGQQPANVPATIDVTFTGLPKGSVSCTPAFFTPH